MAGKKGAKRVTYRVRDRVKQLEVENERRSHALGVQRIVGLHTLRALMEIANALDIQLTGRVS